MRTDESALRTVVVSMAKYSAVMKVHPSSAMKVKAPMKRVNMITSMFNMNRRRVARYRSPLVPLSRFITYSMCNAMTSFTPAKTKYTPKSMKNIVKSRELSSVGW
jgi:hypothetical protein